jgi:hypothetical protein
MPLAGSYGGERHVMRLIHMRRITSRNIGRLPAFSFVGFMTIASVLIATLSGGLWLASSTNFRLDSSHGRLRIWGITYVGHPSIMFTVADPGTMKPGESIIPGRRFSSEPSFMFRRLKDGKPVQALYIQPPVPYVPTYSFLGVEVFSTMLWGNLPDDASEATTFHLVSIPYWWFLALAVPFPVIAAVRSYRRRRRLRMNLCVNCGYDLRHSPGKCPECGTDPVVGEVINTKV